MGPGAIGAAASRVRHRHPLTLRIGAPGAGLSIFKIDGVGFPGAPGCAAVQIGPGRH